MAIRTNSIIVGLTVLSLLNGASLFPQTKNAPPVKAPSFTVEDATGTKQQFTYPRKNFALFGITDKATRFELKKWLREIESRELPSELDKYVIVKLSGAIPFFFRGSIRGSFPRSGETRYLLDWGGKVSRKFDAQRNLPAVVLVSPEGEIVFAAHGALTQDKAGILSGFAKKNN